MKQWHPIFAELLRPLVERYYELTTNVAVGDLPRQADILLLRRTATANPPFQGLWRHLTSWNVLEFKGPTARPRREHLEQLVEVGLGIARRLNSELVQRRQRRLPPAEISFWYLADVPGRQFLRLADRGLVRFGEVESGLWRGEVLEHPVYVVRGEALPVDADSIPFHLIVRRPRPVENAIKELLVSQESLWEQVGEFLPLAYDDLWREISAMKRTKQRDPALGLKRIADACGIETVIEAFGIRHLLSEMDPKDIVSALKPKQMRAVGKLIREIEKSSSEM